MAAAVTPPAEDRRRGCGDREREVEVRLPERLIFESPLRILRILSMSVIEENLIIEPLFM